MKALFSALTRNHKLRGLLYATVTFLSGGLSSPLQAVFDPVNDDTDIFLANPNNPAQRPNVLIVLDNTANWSRQVDGQAIVINELAALQTVVQNLSNQFNVGLMTFPETGTPNDSVDGGVVRFHVRQMDDDNKPVLADLVGALDETTDKSNNSVLSKVMSEAFFYFSGATNTSTFGKEKGDYAGNIVGDLNAQDDFEHEAVALSTHALPASPTDASLYNTPIVDSCAANFIIFLSNGDAAENASSLADSEAFLDDTGYDTSTPIALTPGGREGNWADEWADYMANADVNGSAAGTPNVISYVVEVDPQTTGNNDDHTALMKSMAEKGKGKYFAVTSGNSGQAIVNALNQIFREIQAVNSVFASTTLPVSVNVRGTNLNQVYIGVFRPDEFKLPRWFGNLKAYQLGVVNQILRLVDKNKVSAENTTTGFINPNVTSFWTLGGNDFWDFLPSEKQGAGGAADGPDGDLVEKGGSAQGLRDDFATSQTARNLYTCTTPDCVVTTPGTPGSSLSATPFDTTNAGVNDTTLELSTKLVSTLTALQSQTVSALSDTRSVASMTTADPSASVIIDTLDNGAVDQTVTALKTNISKSISTLTNSPVTKSISNAARVGSAQTTAKITVNGHGYSTGNIVFISGFSATDFNGQFSIAVNDANVFTITCNNGGANCSASNPSVTGTTVSTTSTVVTATVTNHGFANGATVTIAGVTPSTHNGSYASINKINDNSFSYVTASALAPVTSVAGATASGTSTTATATLVGHGYSTNNVITISGVTGPTAAEVAGYNGNFTITKIDDDTFSYPAGASLANATGTIIASKGSTLVTATVAGGHGFADGATITIAGADPTGYNDTYTITVTSPNTFEFTTATVQGTATVAGVALGGANTNEVTANIPGHKFTSTFGDGVLTTTGDQIDITVAGVVDDSGTPENEAGAYNGSNISAEIIDADTVRYFTVNGELPNPATGTITARLSTSTAIATLPAHGYSNGQNVAISGATPTSYNKTSATITVIDTDTFHYPLATVSAQGPASGTITAGIKTTTAVARLVGHGFTARDPGCDVTLNTADDTFGPDCTDDSGAGDDIIPDEVTIAGANPAAFNKTSIEVNVIDNDTFSYTLSSAEGNASGTIIASVGSVAVSEVTNLVNWVRGADNFEDENGDGSFTDIRASVHGDVLHSRPAVVNYNRHSGDGADGIAGNQDDVTDVYIFYGTNDGVFRAVKGGLEVTGAGEPAVGTEIWGFIPEEFFGGLARLRNNEPGITSSTKKPYFADGSIGVYVNDADPDGAGPLEPDGQLVAADGDQVILFISMHRGGRLLYALDVSDPVDPKLMWKRSNNDTGWAELGQTWSVPRVTTISAQTDPVLIFGAGYDPLVEDVESATITDPDADVDVDENLEVVVDTANYERSMGRGIFIVDAFTGDILFQAGPDVSDTGESSYEVVTGMDCAIPADIAVISNRAGSVDNRAYVGDTCGNIWRLDIDPLDVENSTVTRLADLADYTDLSDTPADTTDADSNGLRKFLFPPDVVYGDDFDAVLIGSGDREHPFDEDTVNRFYMIRDTGIVTTAVYFDPDAVEEGDLFDATSNCLQAASGCSGSGDETSQTTAAAALDAAFGWYITLGDGEKVVGNAVTLNNITFFNTNQPSSGSSGTCGSDLGIARQYLVNYDDATAYKDKNLDGSITAADRSAVHPGGGYLPSPVPVVVEIDGQIYEGVISGVKVDQPPGSLLGARLRKFWYKEFE